jgi:acetyl esterase
MMHLSEIEASVLALARRALRALHAPEASSGLRRVEDLAIPGPGGPMRARLYEARDAEPSPLILFFHGGGFICCDVDTHHAMCAVLAEAAGARLLSVEYRLAPETPFPGQMEDASAAGAWALANSGSLGAAPGRIATAGDSAGAYLAARLANELNQQQPGAVALQVLLYPLIHVEDGLWVEEALKDFRFLGRAATAYISRALGAESLSSLLQSDVAHAPRSIVAGGGVLDPLRRDVRAYSAALRNAGVEVEEREYPLLVHGGFNFPSRVRAVDDALREIGALVRAALS